MMEGNIEDANSKLFPANDEPEHELYIIPSSSSWFCWDEIHETERTELGEFFRGFSISRTPKIYKEYRDFIINKFREDPKRSLTFTEIRKCLIGDVSLIHKVFLFLEKWGLINYGLPMAAAVVGEEEEEEKERVKYEEGAPSGVRVVAVPNSVKPVPLTPIKGDGNWEVGENGFRLPPLASYSNVFERAKEGNQPVCVSCGEVSVSGVDQSEKTKNGSSLKCLKCSKHENKGEGKAVDDLKTKDSKDSGDTHAAESWTDAETLLLLESVLKHGDNWDLVAQNVQTKKISDCISKLIQLPFGDLMLSTVNGMCDYRSSNSNTSNIKQTQCTSAETRAPIKEGDPCHEKISGMETGTVEAEDPPLKKRCIDAFVGASDSLMKQVSLLSTAVSPHVAVAASEAAIKALCEENPYDREIFQDEEDNGASVSESPALTNEPERVLHVEKTEVMEGTKSETQEATPEINSVFLTLRIRKAIATAFGAAAAHAKLLADQEDREVEHLVATVIETQLKKINCKIKHFEELQLLMEKELTQIQELKESIIEERIDVLRGVFKFGISRPRSHSFVKPFTGPSFSRSISNASGVFPGTLSEANFQNDRRVSE